MMPLDSTAQSRLADAWRDPEMTVGQVVERFRLTHADKLELNRVLSPKARPLPLSPWYMQQKARDARSRRAR